MITDEKGEGGAPFALYLELLPDTRTSKIIILFFFVVVPESKC